MAPVCLWPPLTHNESLCVRELLEEFPKVFIALLVCRAQHLQWQTESATSTHTHMHAQSHTYTHICFQSSHSSCSLPHSHTTVLPVTQRRLFVSMWDNLVKTSHRVDDFHSVGNFDKHWTWTYSEWQAEVCGLSYLQSLMRLHSRAIWSAIPKTSARCRSFNTHAAVTASIYNKSHILRFALQSSMYLTMRLLFRDKGKDNWWNLKYKQNRTIVWVTWSNRSFPALGTEDILFNMIRFSLLLGFGRLDYLQSAMCKILERVLKSGLSLSAPDAFLPQENFKKQ